MISQARLDANRRNARKSTGPRTAAGKDTASRNAYRHGLAAMSRHHPALFPEIARMAKALCGADPNPFLLEQAMIIAENQLVLQCVRAEQVAVIERMRDPAISPLTQDRSLERAQAHFRVAQLKYERLTKAKAAGAKDGSADADLAGRQPPWELSEREAELLRRFSKRPRAPEKSDARDLDEVIARRRAAPDLVRLERYERRACSRRNKAIDTFIAIRSREAPSDLTCNLT